MEAFSTNCYPRHPLAYYGKKVRQLGKGSYGIVYLLDGGKYGKPVALKSLPRFEEDDEEDKKYRNTRVWKEIALLTQLQHPNIPKIIDVHQTKDSYLIVQESPSVAPKGKQTEETVLNTIRSLAQVYAYLEQEGVMHCDLKEDNILVDKDRAYLIDFGIAMIVSPADMRRRARAPDSIFITPMRAPELILGQEYYDFKVEIWALGVLSLSLLQLLNVQHNLMDYQPYVAMFLKGYSDNVAQIEHIYRWEPWLGLLSEKWPEATQLPNGSFLRLRQPQTIDKNLLRDSPISDSLKILLTWMLMYNPERRANATDILNFLGVKNNVIPTQSECLDRRSHIVKRPKKLPTVEQRSLLLANLLRATSTSLTISDRLITRTYFLTVTLFDLFVAEFEITSVAELELYVLAALVVATTMHNQEMNLNMIKERMKIILSNIKILNAADFLVQTLCYETFQATSFDYLALDYLRFDLISLASELLYYLQTDLVYGKTPYEFYKSALTKEKQKVLYDMEESPNYEIILVPN